MIWLHYSPLPITQKDLCELQFHVLHTNYIYIVSYTHTYTNSSKCLHKKKHKPIVCVVRNVIAGRTCSNSSNRIHYDSALSKMFYASCWFFFLSRSFSFSGSTEYLHFIFNCFKKIVHPMKCEAKLHWYRNSLTFSLSFIRNDKGLMWNFSLCQMTFKSKWLNLILLLW